ncbi:hypothetical protein [Methylobacillus flagellatus]|nr:hypothetical protein [Methylobacillus flagellatus]
MRIDDWLKKPEHRLWFYRALYYIAMAQLVVLALLLISIYLS